MSVRKPSVEHLMGAPLQLLIDELHVDVEESSITSPGFTGVVTSAYGEVIVWLPPNRSDSERDLMTRHLLGAAFRVDGMPPLPEPYRTTDLTADVNRAHRSEAVVANYDRYGSLWGHDTVTRAEKSIVEARANGAVVDEWDVTGRDGQPLRIVRTTDPADSFLGGIDICVIPVSHRSQTDEALRRSRGGAA